MASKTITKLVKCRSGSMIKLYAARGDNDARLSIDESPKFAGGFSMTDMTPSEMLRLARVLTDVAFAVTSAAKKG